MTISVLKSKRAKMMMTELLKLKELNFNENFRY